MKHETQALHLAKMMQKHTRYPTYELTLPLITVRSNKLKKLSVDDVLLIGFDRLEFLLLDGDTICANTQLKSTNNTHEAEIVYLHEDTIKQSDSKKYEILKISFGSVQSKALEIGSTIDITHVDLEKVTLVSDGKTIADGSLVNVDEEIAIQIMKVYI
jgi:sulfate adenylyltransferase subunit 1 (EFTu-like GTPase family)